VVANKLLPDVRRSLVIDAGVNVMFTGFWYNHKVTPLQPQEGAAEDTVVYGPLCMNIDVMRASVMLPPMNVGDAMMFSPVGAYNNTQWMQFIEYRPNVLWVDTEQQVSVVREAENLAIVTGPERLPAHLEQPFREA
jgi:diaminopimelate decarboxylase